MPTALKTVVTAASTILLAGTLLATSSTVLAGDTASPLEEGKKLAFDRKKGNCLACHMIAGGDQPGNIGPPLIAMKARFPDKAALKAQIADARVKNPNSIMIPFGPHGVLTPEELDKVTDFIYSL
jgi:sulfur-oxidizing protein SoxX